MATKVTDYTKMQVGTVTRTFKGRTVGVIGICPACKKRGDKSVSIPEPSERQRTPFVLYRHVAEFNSMSVPSLGMSGFSHLRESCSIKVDATNVDDLLNVEQRKRYDAWVTALREFADQF